MTMTQAEMQETVLTRAGEDEEFRARLLADPREAIEEATGAPIPDVFTVEVHAESATTFHLVLPPTARLTEEEMAQVFAGTGDWNDSHSAQGI